MDLTSKTAHELRALLDRGEATSVEVTRAHLDRIEAVDPKLNAFLTRVPDLALEMARGADDRIRRKETGPLTGIPLGLKDVLVTRGVRTTLLVPTDFQANSRYEQDQIFSTNRAGIRTNPLRGPSPRS